MSLLCQLRPSCYSFRNLRKVEHAMPENPHKMSVFLSVPPLSPPAGYLGVIFGRLRLRFELLGPSWRHLGPILGPSWRLLGPLGAILGLLGALFGPSWGHLGASWALLGPSWASLAPSWGHLGPSWGHLVSMKTGSGGSELSFPFLSCFC